MPLPVVLFGAFDRHNLGDLLFAHVAEALLPGRPLVFAGLADRDLRGVGGHRVHRLADLALAWPSQPAHPIHVGGEILTCGAWQAAEMLLPPDEAPATIACLDPRPRQRGAWVRRVIGLGARAPYVASRLKYPGRRCSARPASAPGGCPQDACAEARRLAPAWVERCLAGRIVYRKPEHVRRATTFLRIAAGLEGPSAADALR